MTPSLLVLLVANAVPIAGVLFLGWTAFPLVLLYWLETVVVGGFNVAKLLVALPGQSAYWTGKVFIVPFFIVHFGMFTLVDGVLVVALLGPQGTQRFDLLDTVITAIQQNKLGWAVVSLVVSHGLSFYWNYVKNGEYQRATMNVLMRQPYARIMVLHFTVLLSGWIVMRLRSPLPALVVLIVLKTAADVHAHKAERRKFSGA